MKALKFLVLAIAACFIFASCNSVDSLIDKYSKACKAGDFEKAEKIAQKLEEKTKDAKLTEEQTTKIFEASMDCAKAGVNKVTEGMKDMDDLDDIADFDDMDDMDD